MNIVGGLYPRKKLYLSLMFLAYVVIITIFLLKTSAPLSVNVTTSHSANIYLKHQSLNENLSNRHPQYETSPSTCKTEKLLTEEQQHAFYKMSDLLKKLRQQLVPYPRDYFYGRGIVLSVGLNQFNFAKVNLKMIELTETKLSVQVRLFILNFL